MIFKNKKAILLIHGFAGGSYDYGELNNDLQLIKNFDVFTYTLPGHDKLIIKKVTEKDWIDKSEKQIEKLINHGYKEIYIIGHSMGGVIATHLASKYKEVKKLVLAAPAFRYFKFKNDKLDIIDSLKIIGDLFKDYKPEEVLSRVFKVPIKTVHEFINLVNDYQDDIKKVTIPTLIIHGTNDEIVPVEAIDYVYNNIPSKNITSIEIKGLTHNLFINNRYNEVKNIIINFLKSHRSQNKEKKEI